MSGQLMRVALLLFTISLLSCGGDEKIEEAAKTESEPKAPEVPEAPAPQAPLIGQPNGSGYTGDSIRVQVTTDIREQHNPSPGSEFLFVRTPIGGSATLIPQDYRIVIDGKQFTPHAIGFGRPNGVYSSVEYFVGSRVDLIPAAADQILHDGQRVQKCELQNPTVFLIYDVPKVGSPMLWHGTTPFTLSPNFTALREELSGSGGTLTAQNQLNLTNPNATSEKYTAERLSSTRTRLEINTTPTDVVIITLGLTAAKPVTIELKKSDLTLQGSGGSAKGRTVYFHFSEDVAKLTPTSTYIEGETYEGRDLIGLESGSFHVSLSPATTVTATLIFPDPKIPGDLDLKLSATHSVRIPEPINPLGKFPAPVEKLPGMVAWAPLIGTPTAAGILGDRASIALNSKQLSSPTATDPADGLRHLVVTFRVDEETQFVPIDYRVAIRDSNTIFRPIGVAFGESPIYVKGLDYEKIPMKFGDTSAPEHQGGRLTGWNLKAHEVRLLYEVEPAQQYIFIHGNTQFVIEL